MVEPMRWIYPIWHQLYKGAMSLSLIMLKGSYILKIWFSFMIYKNYLANIVFVGLLSNINIQHLTIYQLLQKLRPFKTEVFLENLISHIVLTWMLLSIIQIAQTIKLNIVLLLDFYYQHKPNQFPALPTR